ncbi:MAG: zinc-binding dehydrogenase [Bdellovibrionales bacterium]
MKKIIIKSPGSYDKLEIQEFPSLEPGPHQVIISVKGIGVNYADTLVRLGVYESAKVYVGWPITPGFEVSGVVKSVGSKVTRFKSGDQVVAFTRFNGYATEVCVEEMHTFSLPKGFDLLQAAGFPAVFMTAYYALKQLFILPKKAKILVHSAAGGVGSALVQIAKAEGHFVVGIVGRADKVDYVKKMGADLVYDKSTVPDFWSELKKQGHNNFDAVFDANGYTTLQNSYDFLRPTGRLVIYGSHSLLSKDGGKINYLKAAYGLWKTPKFNPLEMVTSNKSIVAFNLSFLIEEDELAKENLSGLLNYANQGKIFPPETTYIPFEKVAEAHQLIESGKSRGKIILTD